MDIKSLIEHIERQIERKDASEPNAQWVVNELKKYLQSKDIVSDMIMNDELRKIANCEWCLMPLKMQDEFMVVMENFGRYRVCPDCLNNYASGRYDAIMSKMKQVHKCERCISGAR